MKRFISMLLCLIVVLTACGKQPNTQDETGKAGDQDMEKIIMTEEEIRLLSAAYGDDERIRQGKLFDYQKADLEQLRAGLSYLEEKYPGTDFEILTFAPATKFTPWAQFLIKGEGELSYTLTVEKTDGVYICLDNCYGLWLREDYDAYVTSLLRNNGITGCTYTNFAVLLGMEIGAETTVAEFVDYTPKINRQTRVYLLAPNDLDSETQKIRELFRSAGLYGHYFVYAVPADQYGSIEELEQNCKNLESKSFNCYDA